MKPTGKDERLVVNIHEVEYQPWVMENGELHDSSVLQLDNSKPMEVGFHVYKMEPGSTTTPHAHTNHEEFLILSGELIENDGTVFREGDLVWLKKGTEHSSYTKTGCTMAVFIETREIDL